MTQLLHDFADEAHFGQLRSLLWTDPGRGRASIMVGAGMSRNAIPLRPDRPPMPLWSDLTAAMAAAVWPAQPSRRGVDALVLAEYFERLHNRNALDDLLCREVRDAEFLPGRLHFLLMGLPWVDVFTTNYDTLLERACQQILERRYSVVVNQADLSGSRQPRIVKLNGSFPSHRPFIITEEDFRTYPVTFAAFVNTVQQAIMETALCMIGFSGTDPNFQAWTGWVRDNLGTAAPPIYHCDVLDLDVARRSYYEARNIRPIDLGPLFPKETWGPSRHSAALEWFILSLADGAPIEIEGWPSLTRRKPALPMAEFVSALVVNPSRRRHGRSVDPSTPPPRFPTAWEPTDGLPPLFGSNNPTPMSASAADTEPERTLARLSALRQSYPGWILSPVDRPLEHQVAEWFKALQAPAARARLDVLSALAWVLDVVNWPWPDDFLNDVEAALDALGTAVFSADALSVTRLLIRESRERDEPERFNRWMTQFASATRGNPLALTEWWLEKAKYHFGRLELAEVDRALRSVTTQPSRPFLDVARGGLLFELGKAQEASAVAAAAVDLLRRQSDPQAPHPRLVGEEASALDLAMSAMMSLESGAISFGVGDPRRRELRRSGSDPRHELELHGAKLGEGQEPQRSITKQFDPGKWTTTDTHRYGNEHLRPYKYLRALDVSAQLPRNHREHVTLAANLLAADRPSWAFLHLIRAGSKLDGAFSREMVVALPHGAVVTLWERCERFLRSALDSRWADISLSVRQSLHFDAAAGTLDLLSRLTVSADRILRDKCLALAMDLHESRELRSIWRLHEPLCTLFERLFLAMPLDEQAEALPKLLKLSIPGIGQEGVAHPQMWRDPCTFVSRLGARLAPQKVALADDATRLATQLRGAEGLVQAIIVTRLNALDEAGGLDDASKRAYVDALWAGSDLDSGVPIVEGFSLHLGLLVSAGYPDPRQRFKAWALGTALPPLFAFHEAHGMSLRQSQAHWVLQHAKALERATHFPWCEGAHVAALIDWSADEAESLLRLVVGWFTDLEQSLAQPVEALAGREVEVLDQICHLVASLIVPRAKVSSPAIRSRLDAINGSLQNLGRPLLLTHPTWLIVDANADVGTPLRRALTSRNDETVRDALSLVFEWIEYGSVDRLPPPPADVVDHVFLLTSLAPHRALSSAFGSVWWIYLRHPEALTALRRGWVQIALERLFRPGAAARETDEPRSDLVPAEQLGDLRAAAARLLTALAIREPGVELWKELSGIAAANPYPEVRRACEEVREQLLPTPTGASG